MPFAACPDYDTPPDETRLWRYYRKPRFAQLLGEGLFLPTFEKLRECDPFEAALVAGELAHLDRVNREHPFSPHIARQMDDVTAHHLYVSCWCEGYHEGIDMWTRYVGAEPDAGVAVVSDVRSLKAVFTEVDSPVTIGRCSYDLDLSSEGHVPGARLHYRKRPCYRHENEVRAVFVHPYLPRGGVTVPVDVEELVHEVRLCPGASEKFRRDLEDFLAQHGVPPVRLRRSELDVRPPALPTR